MHLRGKGEKKKTKKTNQNVCLGGVVGEQAHRNTGNLSIKGKDRSTLLYSPITHIMRLAVGGIRAQTSQVTRGSVASPPKCGNYKYSPYSGLYSAGVGTQAFALVRQTLIN